MNKLYKLLFIGLILTFLPVSQQAQTSSHHANAIPFDIRSFQKLDEQIFYAYAIQASSFYRYSITSDGEFEVYPSKEYHGENFKRDFKDFISTQETEFHQYDDWGKIERGEMLSYWRGTITDDVYSYLIESLMPKGALTNNLCANADPFCTDNGLYTFPAGVGAGSGESGPYYSCLSSTPNPAWYYMRIQNPGNIDIYMYSTPSHDIDFCCWGPFDDPTAPCPYGLTAAKVIDCSYSTASAETCNIPSTAQTGQYYILIITNYSNSSCNISFSKTGGSGTTDCGIMPPLVSSDSPLCVGETLHLSANGASGATYHWSGPNGWSSPLQNPTRTNVQMNMAGTYSCTITLNGQTSDPVSVAVTIYPMPSANFNFTQVCRGTPTQFTSTSTTNPSGQTIESYQWNFGDGSSGTGANVNHTYVNAGTYQASLTVRTGSGACTNTITKAVVVYPNPNANAGLDQIINYGQTATLSGQGGTGTFNYHWEPANKVVNPNSATTQTIALTATTTFTLTVTSVSGSCSDTDAVTISINGSGMTASASADATNICAGESTMLHAHPIGGTGNYTYSWTPTLGLNNPSIQNPVATPPVGTTRYTCHISDGSTSLDVSVSITVHSAGHSNVNATICDNEHYTFFDNEYNISGTYSDTIETQYGCDSIIFLHLTVNPTYTTPISDDFCAGTSYQWFGQNITQPGTYYHTLQSVQGCDSVIELNLSVLPVSNSTIYGSICPGGTYPFFGEMLNSPGTYSGTTTNHWGCDSIVTLILSFKDYYETEFNVDLCGGSYNWAGTEYSNLDTTGTYHWTFESLAGCDSIVTLHLAFHPEEDYDYYVETCDSYQWTGETGETYHTSGLYTKEYTSMWGCEYEHRLHLTINYSKTTNLNLHECDSYEWTAANMLIETDGVFTNHFQTAHDCDSLVTINMDMEYTPEFHLQGDWWPVGGSLTHFTIQEYQVGGFPRDAEFNTTWELNCPNWQFETYGEHNACCKIIISTFENDSIELKATTANRCDTITKSQWIHCTYFNTDDYQDLCTVDIVPNPNNGNMTLKFENMLGEVNVKVYNATGALVDNFGCNNNFSTMSMQYAMKTYVTGMYYFVISSKDRMIAKKVIVK